MGFGTLRNAALACAVATGTLLAAQSATAAVIYSTPGSTYTQNFDSLPNSPTNVSLGNSPIGWTNDNAAPGAGNFSILGWYLFHSASLAEGGFDGHQRVRIGAGTVNTGAFMSFGAAASAERAMGSLISGTTTAANGFAYIAMRLTNNTASTFTEFTLGYDGEQWRDGGAGSNVPPGVPTSKTMTVQYSTFATAINDSPAYSSTTGLDWTTPVFTNTTTGAAVDGNSAGKVTVAPTLVTGFYWAPGTDLWIRWVDPRLTGNQHGMAIDNVTFTATPEPGSIMLLAGAGLLGMLRRRSR
jgi:hypothetical protein